MDDSDFAAEIDPHRDLLADDLHALVIQDRLRGTPNTRCAIIEVDYR